MKRSHILLVALSLLAAMPTKANGPCGAVLCLSKLTAEEAQHVIDIVATGRAGQPGAFERLAQVRATMPELDAAKRGRYALVGPSLSRLGDGVVPAILERLVLTDVGPEPLPPSALFAWKIGLLDTIGKLRDPRATAVLEAVCRSSRIEPELLSAAAAALGRLETDTAAAALVKLSRGPGKRGQAILAGMGHCRRLVVVRRLAEALPEQHDPVSHRDVVRSIATASNSLVWRAGLVTHPDEGPEIRSIASHALVDDFVTRSDLERQTLVKALMVVDDPTTSLLIESERAIADPSLLDAFDHLERRLENNPVTHMATPKP